MYDPYASSYYDNSHGHYHGGYHNGFFSDYYIGITAIATPGVRIAVTTLAVEDTAPTITPTTAITVSRFMEAIDPVMIEVTTATETTGWETTRSRTVAP